MYSSHVLQIHGSNILTLFCSQLRRPLWRSECWTAHLDLVGGGVVVVQQDVHLGLEFVQLLLLLLQGTHHLL